MVQVILDRVNAMQPRQLIITPPEHTTDVLRKIIIFFATCWLVLPGFATTVPVRINGDLLDVSFEIQHGKSGASSSNAWSTGSLSDEDKSKAQAEILRQLEATSSSYLRTLYAGAYAATQSKIQSLKEIKDTASGFLQALKRTLDLPDFHRLPHGDHFFLGKNHIDAFEQAATALHQVTLTTPSYLAKSKFKLPKQLHFEKDFTREKPDSTQEKVRYGIRYEGRYEITGKHIRLQMHVYKYDSSAQTSSSGSPECILVLTFNRDPHEKLEISSIDAWELGYLEPKPAKVLSQLKADQSWAD